MTEFYWTFIDEDGDEYDAEFLSNDQARQSAEDDFVERCVDNCTCQSTKQDIELVKYVYDDNGEPVQVEKHKAVINFMFEATSDLQEHGTWHHGGGGVL